MSICRSCREARGCLQLELERECCQLIQSLSRMSLEAPELQLEGQELQSLLREELARYNAL